MLKTVIVDDEIDSIKTIELIINEYSSDIKIVGKADKIIDAIKTINNKKPDLVFLDIQMRNGTGFDILESIPERNFFVVFVTAYDHYALKAFRYSAIDFIVKPVDIDAILEAIKKAKDLVNASYHFQKQNDTLLENSRTPIPQKLAITTKSCTLYPATNDIIRFEASGNQSIVYLSNGESHKTNRNLRELTDLLTESNFCRIHNSHLVNLKHVKKVLRVGTCDIIMSDDVEVPISRRKRSVFTDLLTDTKLIIGNQADDV